MKQLNKNLLHDIMAIGEISEIEFYKDGDVEPERVGDVCSITVRITKSQYSEGIAFLSDLDLDKHDLKLDMIYHNATGMHAQYWTKT